MGFYIETESDHNKAEFIVKHYGGKLVDIETARQNVNNPEVAVIVVVDNVMFETAGFAYDAREFRAFVLPSDGRKKQFVLMDRKKACELTNFDGPKWESRSEG